MSLRAAQRDGVTRALARFKLASALGAPPGVAPRGEEHSHGTGRHQYPPRSPSMAPASQDPNMPDRLWNMSDISRLAPGRADGTYGQEVIG